MKHYTVMSPDGFSIGHETYKTKYEAQKALAKWVQRYSEQGFYSQVCNNGYVRHIHLHELPDYCQIVKSV